MKRFAIACAVVMVALSVSACGAQAPEEPASETSKPATVDYTKLLTAADVEQVSGKTGVKAVPADSQAGAGGDLNFADETGELIVMANFGDAAWFAAMKDSANYRGPVQGVGEEAFNGPTEDMGPKIYQLGAFEGQTGVLLTSFLDPGEGEPILPQPKLEELAAIVLERAP